MMISAEALAVDEEGRVEQQRLQTLSLKEPSFLLGYTKSSGRSGGSVMSLPSSTFIAKVVNLLLFCSAPGRRAGLTLKVPAF